MDGRVNPEGDVRACSSSGRVSRIYETNRFFFLNNVECYTEEKEEINTSPSNIWFFTGDVW